MTPGEKTPSIPPEGGSLLAQRYEIVRELGRGGMGVVFLCKDLVTSERVALKRLRTPDEAKGQLRPEESWWFHQEARAVASLEHPVLVRARDFGTLADGSPYLVMDALPGRSVHEWMHTTHMPWPVIWSLVDQTLAGLAHAHARGVIHGDLKPSNIMLDMATRTGGVVRAYILDLGLAWLRENRHDSRLDGAPDPELATHAGAGTVGWVAPEQIRKSATIVGPPTDLYALGCIIYRVLVGKEVFEGNAQEVLRAHKRTPVPPLALPAGVPEGVSGFVQKLLAKRPWHRYEYAADARRAWAKYRPAQSATLEEAVASVPPPPAAPSSSPAMGRQVAAARSLAPGLLGLRPSPMVAREKERGELWGIVEEMAAGTTPPRQFIALIGEAGVGKSRLASWLCEQVHERGVMVPLRARYGRIPTPLDGVTGAVNTHYGLEGADRSLVEQTLIHRWEVSVDDDEALTWVAATAEWLRPSPPGTIVPLGPTGKRFVLDTAELRWVVTRKVLERIGKDRPILLWSDDLHLASPNTFEVLSRMLRTTAKAKLLVAATARSESLASDIDAALRLEAARAEWNGRVFDLKALDGEETDALLRSTLPLDDAAVARAREQSRGNPLFALQLLHAWAGGGYLKLDQGRYRVPESALKGRAITTAELWDERLRAVPTELRLSAYAAAALGEDIRGEVLKTLVLALGMDPREAMVELTRAQILLAGKNDQFRWPHALLLEHLLGRLQERHDAPAIFRLAANALAKHPAVGSRRIMKHRVANLLRAGDDDVAATLMFRFIEGSWRRGRDTQATLKDLQLLDARVSGRTAAEYAYWRAEALRHTGKLDEAREQAETALRVFLESSDDARTAHAMRLLGHIDSDIGAPARGRERVLKSIGIFEKLGDEAGAAQAQVVLGEIDYLLGEHERARNVLLEARERCTSLGDSLGGAQCLILLAMIAIAVGGHQRSRELLAEARAAFDATGYRLGLAQCDAALGHADHRAFEMESARSHALTARASFRELHNPRGEAACERLLAMIAIDTGDYEASALHARVAAKIYEKLRDPWGDLETLLLLAQVALAEGASGDGNKTAAEILTKCDELAVDEAEPRQHRHLTRAWLAQRDGRVADAAREIDSARAVYGDRARAGDHTPHLLERFRKMRWGGDAGEAVDAWAKALAVEDPEGSARWRTSEPSLPR